jgi:hypothetical protein
MRQTIATLLLMMALGCNGSASPDPSETPADQQTEGTSEPTVCAERSGAPNACECSTEDGFTTYRFQQDDTERCFTTYVDPETAKENLPLVFMPDCYTANALQPPGAAIELAQKYNVRIIELSSPTGGWTFPLDNQVNQDNHGTQCDPESTPDIGYMEAVFTIVDQMAADGTVDPDKIYVSGFSQNAMFSIFAATCFPQRIRGIDQGGSGLYSQDDGALALPQCEGACTRTDFQEHGDECVDVAPCDDCSYFPVLPTSSDDAFHSCIFMYDNDGAAHSTAVPAHRRLTQAGHDASLHIFASDEASGLGGHETPVLRWEWVNSCLEVNPPCSSQCEEAVTECIADFQQDFRNDNGGTDPLYSEEGRGLLYGVYQECQINNSTSCARGCAATQNMLLSVEAPACTCAPGQADCSCTTSNVPGPCQDQ